MTHGGGVNIKVSQTNKWSWYQALDLPNYVVHVSSQFMKKIEFLALILEVTLFYRLQWELQYRLIRSKGRSAHQEKDGQKCLSTSPDLGDDQICLATSPEFFL